MTKWTIPPQTKRPPILGKGKASTSGFTASDLAAETRDTTNPRFTDDAIAFMVAMKEPPAIIRRLPKFIKADT